MENHIRPQEFFPRPSRTLPTPFPFPLNRPAVKKGGSFLDTWGASEFPLELVFGGSGEVVLSYDLQVWSVRRFDRGQLKVAGEWRESSDGGCSLGGAGWQIVVNGSDEVDGEDVPEEVAGLLPGIKWLTELNLEGDPPKKGMELLRRVGKEIAKGAHGVVVDPQEDEVVTPAGVKRYEPVREKKFPVMGMTWWFLGDVLEKKAGREKFLGLLEKRLPEAMPKRYGLWEPPQHKLEKTGRGHLEKFLGENLHDHVVWYPTRPVTSVSVGCPKPLGASVQGFRSNYVEIEFETALLEQPGWLENLKSVFREMAKILRPIYGEVRDAGMRLKMGATVGFDARDVNKQEPLVTRAWFWRGVPPNLGRAVVLGEEYQKLWPGFLKGAEVVDGLAFLVGEDWTKEEELAERVGGVPKGVGLIAGEGMGREQEWPRIWPFGEVFAGRR